MIIVSDTSVITNLIQLNYLHVLNQLFGEIIIPEKVYQELGKIEGQIEIINQTSWIEIKSVSNQKLYHEIEEKLDPGEAEAITLAIELKAEALLIDEKKGRKIAQEYGILITGLLGILIDAKEEKIIPALKPVLKNLIFEIGFRISPKLYQEVLSRVNE